jgi:hypothetical protein
MHAVELALGVHGGLRAPKALHERPGKRALGIAGTELGWRLRPEQQRVPRLERGIRDAERLAVDLVRGLGDADVIAERLRHPPLAVGSGEDRHRHHRLLRHAKSALDVAPQEQVELLVGAAQLDVGADRHRVVSLHERVQKLEHRDRRSFGKPLGEVLALGDLGDGG